MTKTPIQLRFADCDSAGHVHNAAYLHYFETARMHFFVSQLGMDWDWKKNGIILKKNIVDYHIPTFLKDSIEVEVVCAQIGTKSFTLSYIIKNQDGKIKTTGSSLMVCFDYLENQTIEIPEPLKKALQNHLDVTGA